MVAAAPATVAPVRLVVVVGLVSVICGPKPSAPGGEKFEPLIVMTWPGLTPNTTGVGATLVIVGCGAVTMKPPTRLTVSPPAAGFVTRTSYTPRARDRLHHPNCSSVGLTYT